MDVEHLNVVLNAKLAGLQRGLNQADRAVAKTRSQLTQLQRVANHSTASTAAGAARAATSMNGLARAAQNVRRQTARIDSQLSRVGSGLAHVAKRAAQTATVVGGGLVSALTLSGFRFNALLQRSQIAFTTMLGSAGRARRMLADLAEFARRTPFELPGLIQASQRLVAFGFEAREVIPLMTAVGDAVAAMGGSPETLDRTILALGQIQAKGRVMAEEMLQLTEAGTFGWRDLAREIGVSVPEAMKLVERGAVSSDAFLAAFMANSERRFKGMMEKQSRSFTGLVSNLRDTWAQVSGRVTKPLFTKVQAELERLVRFTQTPAFTEGVERFARWLEVKIPAGINAAVSFFQRNWGSIKDGFLSGAAAAAAIVRTLAEIGQRANSVARAVGGWREVLAAVAAGWVGLRAATLSYFALVRVQAMLTAGTIRLALISTGIGAVVVAAGIAAELTIRHWEKVRGWFIRLGRALPLLFEAAMHTVVAAANLAAAKLIAIFTKPITTLLRVASHLPFGIGDQAKAALNRIEGFIDGFEQRGSTRMAAAGQAWGAAFAANLAEVANTAIATLESGAVVRPEEGSRGGRGRGVRLSGDLDSTPAALSFARKLGAVAGESGLQVSSGRRTPAENKAAGGAERSDHLTGNAIDISASGERLTRLGQSALIAAGMDPGKARKISSFASEFNGYYIEFGTGDHLDHLHVSVRAGAKTITLPSTTDPVFVPAGINVRALPKKLTPAERVKAAVDKARDTVSPKIRESVEKLNDLAVNGILPSALVQQLEQRAERLKAALKKADTKAEVAAINREASGLNRSIDGAVKQMDIVAAFREKIQAAKGEVQQRLQELFVEPVKTVSPAALRKAQELAAKIDRKLTTTVVSDAARKRLQAQLAAQQQIIIRGLAGMLDAVERAQGRFESAWGKIAQGAMKAFDAETARGLREIQERFAVKTPARVELDRMEAEREAAQARRELADANSELADAENDLQKARASGDPDELAAAEERLMRARQRLDDIAYEERRQQLEAQAVLEERALEEQEQREIESWEQRRAEQREQLEAQLAEWKQQIMTGGEAAIGEIEQKLGPLAEAAGGVLGVGFTGAWTEAFKELRKLWNEFLRELNTARVAVDLKPITFGSAARGSGGVRAMSHGGQIGGSPRWPRDGVPIVAAGGEHVLNPPQIALIRRALASAGPHALTRLRAAATGRSAHLRRFLPSGGSGSHAVGGLSIQAAARTGAGDDATVSLLRNAVESLQRLEESLQRLEPALQQPRVVDMDLNFAAPPAADPHAYAQRAKHAMEAHLG